MTTPTIGSRLSLVAIILISVVVAACGGDSSQAPGIVAPTGLAYSVNPAVYTVGTAITANTPSSSGGAVTSYSVSPALPGGLSLSTTTGVISGNPTAVTAIASYTVTASNSAGSTTVGLSITVNAAVVAPTGLAYSVESCGLHGWHGDHGEHPEQWRRRGHVLLRVPRTPGWPESEHDDGRHLREPHGRDCHRELHGHQRATPLVPRRRPSASRSILPTHDQSPMQVPLRRPQLAQLWRSTGAPVAMPTGIP